MRKYDSTTKLKKLLKKSNLEYLLPKTFSRLHELLIWEIAIHKSFELNYINTIRYINKILNRKVFTKLKKHYNQVLELFEELSERFFDMGKIKSKFKIGKK